MCPVLLTSRVTTVMVSSMKCQVISSPHASSSETLSREQIVKSTRAKSRKTRVYKFFKFLRKHYSTILNDDNAFILDVAGGKGDLSFMIANIYDSSPIVVDPRNTNHTSLLRSISFLKQNPELVEERSVEGSLSFQPLAALLHELEEKRKRRENDWISPINMQIYFNDDLIEAVYKEYEQKGSWEKFWLSKRWNDAISAEASWAYIMNTKLIVGFHPDQATESIVDFALFMNIPFAIVPCCVFPSEFPNRRWNGERVRDHRVFIEYLKAKHPKIQVEKLDFDFCESGKNTVLFTELQE